MNAILYLLRTGYPWALAAARRVSAMLDGVQHFSQVPACGVWEVIWAELQMALRERTGREPSPSAAVLDSQSVKSAEKGAAMTTSWMNDRWTRATLLSSVFEKITYRSGTEHEHPPIIRGNHGFQQAAH
jgi:transposase